MNEEMNEQSSKTLASPKLSKVVLIVLAAHVVLILGFGTYCLLKGNTSGKDSGKDAIANTEESGETGTVATSGSQPAIETNASETTANVAPVATDTPVAAAGTTPSPMPSTQDPIWSSAANNQSSAVNPAPAQSGVTSVPATANAGTYAVQKGDSLYKIARKNNVTVAELKQANGLTSDALKIGQKLNIPDQRTTPAVNVPAVAANSQPAPATTTQNVVHSAVANSNAASFQSYKVAPGDTLWKIARNFNTKPDVIAKANNISDPSKLKVGMEIKVPAPSRETAQPQAAIPNVDVAGLPHNRS
jgi:LysM repeat protein